MAPSWTRIDRLVVHRAVVPLQADADLEVLLLRGLGRLEHPPHARRVDGDRLLHEHVLALLDGVLEVLGPEARRRRVDDDVDAGVDDLPVRVEADVLVLGRHLEALAVLERSVLSLFGEARVAVLQPVLERVGHGDELDRPGSRERLRRGARAAAAAADQADPQRRVAAGLRHVVLRVRRGCGPAADSAGQQGRRGPGDEVASRGSVHRFSPRPVGAVFDSLSVDVVESLVKDLHSSSAALAAAPASSGSGEAGEAAPRDSASRRGHGLPRCGAEALGVRWARQHRGALRYHRRP